MRCNSVVAGLFLVFLAACSSSGKTDQGAARTTSPATAKLTHPATPPTSPAPPITISAFIVAVNLPGHTITVDPMAFLTGTAAKTAFQHDHPDAREGPPNDYYISDPKK